MNICDGPFKVKVIDCSLLGLSRLENTFEIPYKVDLSSKRKLYVVGPNEFSGRKTSVFSGLLVAVVWVELNPLFFAS